MNDRRVGQLVRARRHQRGWRLVDLAAAAGVGRSVCSLFENGRVDRLTVRTARAIAGAVGLPLEWDVGWQRAEADRLLDADHAALAAFWVRRLEGFGWLVRSEVSFNHYGDRGRIDILAYHPTHRVLLVIEIKTALVDAQELIGGLDIKTRIAPLVAKELGWLPRLTVPAIVIAESSAARRRLADIDALFSRYALRGPAAQSWLRDPFGSPSGLLTFTTLPSADQAGSRRAGRRRVRRRGGSSRSAGGRAQAEVEAVAG
jgi:transcriptional regulator with XRE-family HTH domain